MKPISYKTSTHKAVTYRTITPYAVKPAVAVLAAALAMGTVVMTAEAANKGGSETASKSTNKVNDKSADKAANKGVNKASSKNENETVSISEYTDWGDPAMAKIAVDSGRALIAHLSTARALLDTNQTVKARSALVAGREFADAIERTMPYLTIVEDIQDASKRVVEEDVTALSTDLLPIYASLDELQVYAPEVAKRTRGVLKQAKKHVAEGNKKRAAQVLTEAADDITQSTVYLPVGYVDEQVHVALYALDQEVPDVTAAKAAVNRALDSVTTVIDEVVNSVN